jgi:hypothetical protein
MAVPVVTGSSAFRNTTNSAVFDISSIADGSWMIISVMSSANSTVVAAPGSWSVFEPGENTGTRRNYLFGKIKQSTDGNSVTLSQSATATVAYSITWGTGSSDIAYWTIGTPWLRGVSTNPQASGSRNSNIALGVTTPARDHLALIFSHEATTENQQAVEVASVTPDEYTQRLYLAQVSTDRLETIYISSKDVTGGGATSDTTVRYSSTQDNNGWAMQIAISSPYAGTGSAVVGTPTTYVFGSAPASISIPRPTGILNGDYIIVGLRHQIDNATAIPSSTNFTHLGATYVAPNVETRSHAVFGHAVTDSSSEPPTYPFTIPNTGGRIIATAFIVRGVDLTNPVSGFYNSYTGTAITSGRRSESYALSGNPLVTLFFGSAEFVSGNVTTPATTPAGFTEVMHASTDASQTVSRTYLWVGKKEPTTSPVPASEITWVSSNGAAAESITLRSSSLPPADPAGVGITAYNGSKVATKVYYTTSNGIRTPSALVPMRRGFNTVAEMLAKPGFTWAHRGGSLHYPEMALYSYTQSVLRGYGVLEVSLARTSDGVWFGLHDQTTDRTSGGTYGNASSQTWAQIQAQQNTVGTTGAPQPYMRWEQLIAIYGKTHIIVADPKFALGSYRTEFLNMVNRDLGPTRAIIKYFGGGSGAALLSTDARALGFETWGFFYANNASSANGGDGQLQTWGPNWTILGMDYNASQAIWNEAKALGKPVVAHIVPDQAGYDSAILKGASGAQVSGVDNVKAVSWWTL